MDSALLAQWRLWCALLWTRQEADVKLDDGVLGFAAGPRLCIDSAHE